MCKQQCSMPARQTRSEFVRGVRVAILICEDRGAANMRTEARAGGYGVQLGMDHTGQKTVCGSVLYHTRRDHELTKAEGGGLGW